MSNPSPPPTEPILRYFAYEHLPLKLQAVSRPFSELKDVIMTLPRSPERTVALRKLLESKDAAVRAALEPEAEVPSRVGEWESVLRVNWQGSGMSFVGIRDFRQRLYAIIKCQPSVIYTHADVMKSYIALFPKQRTPAVYTGASFDGLVILQEDSVPSGEMRWYCEDKLVGVISGIGTGKGDGDGTTWTGPVGADPA